MKITQHFILAVLFTLLFCSKATSASHREIINYGTLNPSKINRVLSQAQALDNPGEQIALISSLFLSTPYVAGTMVGDTDTAEALVVRFDGVDCFTLLDYVEALRRSASFEDFKTHLKDVRYQDGVVGYQTRHHFFSDWVSSSKGAIGDITAEVAGSKVRFADKKLNRKEDGSVYLAGITVKERRVAYIPPGQIDGALLKRLKTGDYLGIYSDKIGLDVTHTGIILQHQGRTLLRHASPRRDARKVVDVDLLEYLKGRKGLVVYRVLEEGRSD